MLNPNFITAEMGATVHPNFVAAGATSVATSVATKAATNVLRQTPSEVKTTAIYSHGGGYAPVAVRALAAVLRREMSFN